MTFAWFSEMWTIAFCICVFLNWTTVSGRKPNVHRRLERKINLDECSIYRILRRAAPNITNSLLSGEVEVGSFLRCAATGFPPPRVKLQLLDQEGRWIVLASGSSELQYRLPQTTDAGRWTVKCEASSTLGVDKKKSSFILKTAPRITSSLPSGEVKVGSFLRCAATGFPPPRVKLQLLDEEGRWIVLVNGSSEVEYRLSETNDAGRWTVKCEASNPVGLYKKKSSFILRRDSLIAGPLWIPVFGTSIAVVLLISVIAVVLVMKLRWNSNNRYSSRYFGCHPKVLRTSDVDEKMFVISTKSNNTFEQ